MHSADCLLSGNSSAQSRCGRELHFDQWGQQSRFSFFSPFLSLRYKATWPWASTNCGGKNNHAEHPRGRAADNPALSFPPTSRWQKWQQLQTIYFFRLIVYFFPKQEKNKSKDEYLANNGGETCRDVMWIKLPFSVVVWLWIKMELLRIGPLVLTQVALHHFCNFHK